MSKKIALSCLVTSAVLASSLAMVLSSSSKIIPSHTKAVNEVKTVTNVTSSSLTMSNHYSVEIESSGYTSGGLFSLSSLGYIRNSEPIRGITEITLTYGTGSGWAKIVPCYYDYENDQVSPSDSWPDPSENADFSSAPIDYFEIYNPNENKSITITSMTIAYGCSTETYTFSVSFTPDWNDKTAPEHADIYIAGTQELISDGTSSGGWNYKKLTYNNGTYSYNALGYLPQGKYSYSFYASKNGEAINWSNECANGTQNITLTSNYLDNTSYSWEREPGSATTYTLNILLYETDSGAWATWRGFNYSTTSSGIASGSWGANLSWDSKSGNVDQYSKNGFTFESTSTTVYIALKVGMSDGSSSIDPAYVGASTSQAFTINYTGGATTATLTINMTFTSATTYYAATSYNVETSGGIDISGMSHPDVTLDIYDNDYDASTIFYGRRQIIPSFESGTDTFKATYSGNNIRIDTIDGNQYITALKAGTSTVVTLTCDSDSSVTCNFTVTVPSSTYSATSTRDNSYNGRAQKTSTEEGWFSSTNVSEISGMSEDFFHGMDISSCKALYENGTNFYNTSGVEQSLFYILKDAGVNWIRLKLWVDPYTTGGVSYGGGESDINNTLWMAYEAKAAGLNVLLDFHYSDYWTHPAQQILPKAWANAGSVSALATLIKNYTKDTLNTFNSNGCLPDMVQLGNEISSGSFLSLPGTNSETMHDVTHVPGYLYNISGYNAYNDYSLSKNFAYKADAGSSNMNTYLSAGVEAVNEINTSLSSDIKTVVHWAKGSTITAGVINTFFNAITADYDYAAISFYPYYCFDNIKGAQTILNGLNITTANEGWFVAEISYPFSGYSYVYENNQDVTNFIINDWNKSSYAINSSYAFNAEGQAKLIHDVTAAVVNAGGKGMFYWEPAWVPNINVGWAGEGSLCTWSNQGFFSYDGKAIANINLFAQMSPYI